MSLRDRILSDINIYAAIHALPNTLKEKSLICGDHQQYLKDLREIYRYGASHDKFITRCKDKLRKALDDELNEPFKVSIFLKFKDGENGCTQYRPIHNCDIETHVCLLAMLQVLCFEDDYEKGTRGLSGLSTLIPKNYWGNRISTNGNEIYKPWAPAYTSFIQETINKAKKYKNNRQYNNEINLDFQDFFPSINLGWLSNTIKNKLSNKYTSEEDTETLNRILELLMYFEIESAETYNDRELSIYYGQPTTFDESTTYYTKGLPQGLPHTYFFANIAMAEIEPYIRNEFDGDADFYVDDAVIFCNCDKNAFKASIDRLNFLFDISDINTFNYSEYQDINEFQKSHFAVGVKLHRDQKSSIIDLTEDSSFTSDNLAMLYRNASGISIEIRTSLSDLNDQITLNETQTIIKAIQKELDRLRRIKDDSDEEDGIWESICLYEKRIKSYYKYYTFRKLLLLKKKSDTSESIFQDFSKLCNDLVENNDIDSNLDYLVFQNLYRLLLSDFYTHRSDIIDLVTTVDKALSHHDESQLIQYNHLYYATDAKYSTTISDIVGKYDYSEFETVVNYSPVNNIKFLKRSDNEREGIRTIISTEHCFINGDAQHFISCIDTNFKRQGIFIKIKSYLDIPIDCGYNYYRKTNRPLLWYQLRLLHYLNLPHFTYTDFKAFSTSILEQAKGGAECYPVDYSIFQVLPFFATYVKDHIKNDILIQAHHYVYDIWKNGSKFLHFYTLHNAEHSITLIRKCIELTTACGYFKLTSTEFYILFLSCYLHDISMVTYPDINSFDENQVNGQNHTIYWQNEILKHYDLVDKFFEEDIRNNHPKNSATIIRKGRLGFELDEFVRNAVARISEAHGAEATDIYTHNDDSEIINSQKLKIMLRIVDTLDMCEERVSPYYLSLTEEQIPDTSKFHWISHLAIKSCNFETKYDFVDEIDDDICATLLDFKNIKEQIRLIIKLNTRQETSTNLPENLCENIIVTQNNDGVNAQICEGKCNMTRCPFVCRWMNKKSEYLLPELYELQKLLNDRREYYNTNFSIEYKYSDTEQMGRHIPFISRYLDEVPSTEMPTNIEDDLDELPF